jgi:hypothetical protein
VVSGGGSIGRGRRDGVSRVFISTGSFSGTEGGEKSTKGGRGCSLTIFGQNVR